MKGLFPLLAVPLLLTSCEKRAALLEGTGNVKSPGGTWDVTVESAALKVTYRKIKKLGIPDGRTVKFTSCVAPSDWRTEAGAFVYFDEKDRVWAFNGKDRSFIYEMSDKGGRSWDFETYRHPFPAEVVNRLPEALAVQHQNRGK